MSNHYRRWQILAPLGLALSGLGASLLGHATLVKQAGKPFWQWFVWGTVSLCIFNAGVAIFGEAVKERTLYELEMKSSQKPPAA